MMIFSSETYSADRPLFARLGLHPFAYGDNAWHDCGTVETDRASVRVEVSCMPAQFWRFTITPKIEDVQGGIIETGSGTLAKYWPIVQEWAQGMLAFRAGEEAKQSEPAGAL